jgi:hypothetical protein
MRIPGLTALVCAVCLGASAQDSPEVSRAKAEVERLRTLVAAGAAPRNQLDRAEERIADAEDAAFLRRTLYGADLTAEQADEMIAAAARRVERRQKALDAQDKLVKAQVAPATSLEVPAGEVDLARKEYALAETRAELTRQLAAMAEAEDELERQPANSPSLAERFDGNGVFTAAPSRRWRQRT